MKQLVLFIVLLAMLTSLATAQKPLTLPTAVQLATDRNTNVVQARNTLDARRSTVEAAYGNLLPTVGLSGNWSLVRSQTSFVNGYELPGSGEVATRRTYSADIGANVTLFDGFANTTGIKQANARESASSHDLVQSEKSAIFRTNQLFLDVFRKYQLLKVNEDNLKRSQQQLTRISEANKVGSVALADVYRQRVQVGSDELALIQAQNDYEQTKADLFAFLAIDEPSEYTVDFQGIQTDIDANEFNLENTKYSNFGGLVNQATENRADYLSSLQSISAADAGVEIARSGYLPTVSARAGYGYTTNDLAHFTDNNSLSFGLSVSYPIFNGFQTKSQVEQALVTKRNAEEQHNQTQRQIRVELRKALLDFEASQKQIVVTKTSVESAEMDRKIAEEKYNLGAGTLLDVLIANANYTTAVSNKVNAVIGYLLSKKQVEYALGTISQ